MRIRHFKYACILLILCVGQLNAQVNISTITHTNKDTCEGSIILEVDPQLGPYIYEWNTGANTKDLYDLCAGIYSATVTSAIGCQDYLEVQVETLGLEEINIVDNVQCEAESYTVRAIKPDPTYSINWYADADGMELILANSDEFYPTEAGTYYARATNTDGLEGEMTSFEFIILPQPDIEGYDVHDIDFNSQSYNLRITLPSGVRMTKNSVNYVYPPYNTGTFYVAGVPMEREFAIYLTNEICEVKRTIRIPEEICNQLAVSFESNKIVRDLRTYYGYFDIHQCDNEEVYISANVDGGSGDYSYLWSDSNISISRKFEPVAAYNNLTYIYTITATDEVTSCTSTQKIARRVSPINFRIDVDKELCVGKSTEIEYFASTFRPYSVYEKINGEWVLFYQWSALATWEPPRITYDQDIAFREFKLVATIADCSEEEYIKIRMNHLSTDISPTNPQICQGSDMLFSANISEGSGNYQYEWTKDGVVVSSAKNYTDSGSLAGVYDITLTVTDAAGCKATSTTTLHVRPLCDKQLVYNSTSCEFTWYSCSGWQTRLQRKSEGIWSTVDGASSPYNIIYDEEYRLVHSKSGCVPQYSSSIYPGCLCSDDPSIDISCIDKTYNVIYLVDVSGSVGDNEFSAILNTIQNTSGEIADHSNNSNFAIISYDNIATLQVPFTSDIGDLTFTRPSRGGTYYDAGFTAAYNYGNGKSNLNIIHLTDGPPGEFFQSIIDCKNIATVSTVRWDEGLIEYPNSFHAATASLGGSYNGSVDDFENDPDRGSKPRRFYYRGNNYNGEALSDVVSDILDCDLMVNGITCSNPLFEWNTGETSPTIEINSPGDYSSTVTCENGCVYEVSATVNQDGTIQSFTSYAPQSIANQEINEEQLLESKQAIGWTVYPNPTYDYLNVQINCKDFFLEATDISIYDLTGSKIMTKRVTLNTMTSVDISVLSAGLYYLRAESISDLSVKKIIKL